MNDKHEKAAVFRFRWRSEGPDAEWTITTVPPDDPRDFVESEIEAGDVTWRPIDRLE